LASDSAPSVGTHVIRAQSVQINAGKSKEGQFFEGLAYAYNGPKP
jgi:hypothetical protein